MPASKHSGYQLSDLACFLIIILINKCGANSAMFRRMCVRFCSGPGHTQGNALGLLDECLYSYTPAQISQTREIEGRLQAF